ncbi:MAG: hypothetical protein AB7F19_07785 [Candidatus Babeliales bacterium]
MTVACVLWGKEKYNRGHVESLRKQVAGEFVCLTDDPWAEWCVGIDGGLPGWWSKLELFSGRFDGPVLYLDLDVLITGDLREILSLPCPKETLWAIGEWKAPMINSSVMYFNGCKVVWDAFKPDVMEKMHGDQDWIGFVKPDFIHLPKGWVQSYKYSCVEGVPEGCKVVTFQGKPKIEDVRDGWVASFRR